METAQDQVIEIEDDKVRDILDRHSEEEGDKPSLKRDRDAVEEGDDVIFLPDFLTKKRSKVKFAQFKTVASANDKLDVVIIEFKKVSDALISLTVQSLNVHDTSVPYFESRKEVVRRHKIQTLFPGVTVRDTRDPLIIKFGDVFKINSFDVSSFGPDVSFGTIACLVKLKYYIDFEFADIPKGDDVTENGFKRYKGDPVIKLSCKVNLVPTKTIYDFADTLKLMNERLPPMGTVNATAKYIDYPESCRLKGAYEFFKEKREKSVKENNSSSSNQSWAGTFVFPGSALPAAASHDTSESDNNFSLLENPYNWTVVDNDILFQQPYCARGYWVYMCNYIGMYEDKKERLKNQFGLPTLSFNIPPLDKEETVEKKGSGYIAKKKDSSTFCILRDVDSALTGVVMEPGKKIPVCVTTPALYNLNRIYNIYRDLDWKQSGQHLFRCTAGLAYLNNPVIEAAESVDSGNLFFRSKIKCWVDFVLDPMKTFYVGGLEVSKQFALSYVLGQRSKKASELGENMLVSPELSKPNHVSSQFSKSNGDWCPPFINVKEVTGPANVLFASGNWRFFMVPDNRVILDENNEEIFEDSTNAADVLGSLMFEDMNAEGNIDNNESFIKENWFADKIKKSNTLLYAVFKSD